MTDPVIPAPIPTHNASLSAPFVYFDTVPVHGVMNGAIQVEIAARTLMAGPDGKIAIEFVTTGHLRCSPAAAKFLRDAIDAALKMLEEMQERPATPDVAPGKLN